MGFGRVVLMGAGNISDTNLVMISPLIGHFPNPDHFQENWLAKKVEGMKSYIFMMGMKLPSV